MEARPCKLCGRTIQIVRDAKGKLMALEKSGTVYMVDKRASWEAGDDEKVCRPIPGIDGFINHAPLCAKNEQAPVSDELSGEVGDIL